MDPLGIKHVIFVLGAIIAIPVMGNYFSRSPKHMRLGAFLLVFSIPFTSTFGISFFGDGFYVGLARGFEFYGTDLIGAGLLIAMHKAHKKISFRIGGIIIYTMYVGTGVISAFGAVSPIHSCWGICQQSMMFLLLIVLYNYIVNYRDIEIVVIALASISCYNFLLVLDQKLLQGAYQPDGLFEHRNIGALLMNMITPMFLAYLLNNKPAKGDKNRWKFYLCAGGVVCSLATVILALSRGAIVAMPIALGLTIFASLAVKLTLRKVIMVTAFLIVGVLAALRGATMMIDRFANAPESSGNGRILLAYAAVHIADIEPTGMGLNNWVIGTGIPYLYVTDEVYEAFDAQDVDDFHLGVVETCYLAHAAECGWYALGIMLLWFFYLIFEAFMNAVRYRKTTHFYMPLGIFCGLFAAYAQSVLEWVLRQTVPLYIMITLMAVTAAMRRVYIDTKRGVPQHR